MNKLPFDINEVKWQDFGEGIKSCVWKPMKVLRAVLGDPAR